MKLAYVYLGIAIGCPIAGWLDGRFGRSRPILMLGAQNGIMTNYNCGYDYFFVIGGDGIIKWRGAWDETRIRGSIEQGIAELGASAVPRPATVHHLLPGYPNPFNPTVQLPFELSGDSGTLDVRLEILDLRGRIVRTLIDAALPTGRRHEATWNGADASGRPLPSGTYMSRLTVAGRSQSRLVTLVK